MLTSQNDIKILLTDTEKKVKQNHHYSPSVECQRERRAPFLFSPACRFVLTVERGYQQKLHSTDT